MLCENKITCIKLVFSKDPSVWEGVNHGVFPVYHMQKSNSATKLIILFYMAWMSTYLNL